MLLMVDRLLTRAGFRVRCFQRPAEAIEALRQAPGSVDVVVSDLNMPELSGLDVAQAAWRIEPGLPVVISSGFLSDELREKLAAAGVAGVLQKERTLEELAETIRRVLSEASVR